MSSSGPHLAFNPLPLLPGKARQVIYVTYGVLVLAGGGAVVGYAAAGAGLPTALVVANAVLLFLGTPVSALAAANVSPVAQVEPYEG